MNQYYLEMKILNLSFIYAESEIRLVKQMSLDNKFIEIHHLSNCFFQIQSL